MIKVSTIIAIISATTNGLIASPQHSTFVSFRSVSPSNVVLRGSTTVIPETETETFTKRRGASSTGTGTRSRKPFVNDKPVSSGKRKSIEYLQDDTTELRGLSDPHHILLLGYETYAKERITVPYVTGSLMYVLDMPEGEAVDHAEFAKEQGLSILGTWPRRECLELGGKLQMRDLECRVVPGTPAGAQGWQAKDADAEFDVWDVPSISAE